MLHHRHKFFDGLVTKLIANSEMASTFLQPLWRCGRKCTYVNAFIRGWASFPQNLGAKAADRGMSDTLSSMTTLSKAIKFNSVVVVV
jgi:hypothetical protein